MRRPRPGPSSLLLPLDPAAELPLYRQLYAALRSAVLTGRLAPGSWLPSSRVLAAELGVSRNTVLLAFDQLRTEGYLEGGERSGTRVAEAIARRASQPARSRQEGDLSARGRTIAALRLPGLTRGIPAPRPFRAGLPALDGFPNALWARLAARRWRSAPALEYGDPSGFAPLREAVAEYARAGRGARCSVDQVIVVSGSQQGLDLSARVLLDPGEEVWMEDPGYPGSRAALVAAGARPIPVPVDDEGIVVDEGRRRAPRARLAYVSPSHQFPLGVTMSAPRRLALLRWAADARAWILEDDYDSEFRYDARPLSCLQGMDAEGRVVYIGTFSKTLAPGLRLGYLIVPDGLVDAFRAARSVADRHSPVVDQATLADFLAQGHFARHVRRMRRVYLERQEALLAACRSRLGDRLQVEPRPAGMHLTGWLQPGVDDEQVSEAAARAGVEAAPLSRYALDRPPRGGLLLGYAGYDPGAIAEGVRRLAPALR